MAWMAAQSLANLLTALNADIVQEVAAADHYLQLAGLVKRLQHPSIGHQIAVCAATAISNATALAAEVLVLGGAPPSPLPRAVAQPPATSIEEHVLDARAELAHYQDRVDFAERLGLLRLRDVFQQIVQSKRRHLAHARLIASACWMRRSKKTKRERSDANRSTHE